MKKTLVFITILLLSLFGFGQDTSEIALRDIKKNEVSINPLNLIAFAALDVDYERVLNSHSTLGFDFFYRFSDSTDDNDDIIDTDGIFDKEIAFTTRFKYFFGHRIARGFYVEAFGMLSSGEHDTYVEVFNDVGNFIGSRDVEEAYTDFALGFAVGGKFVARNGFFIDLGFGLGRNLFSKNSPQIILRPNLYLGYRF
ncbi:hypothetical protein [Aquimarina sp. RZ0]|uniref:hypothetical protein n=1 Tax=Aquimarina sp. RZ0 TaxID=2607730 RepID=UPI0011F3A7C2|nr:hypothetical protein [Aquimarina sp. RZ0]KAA1246960.1 hypothetical protein F0000_05730 [Aquimarina sp. RZ0]